MRCINSLPTDVCCISIYYKYEIFIEQVKHVKQIAKLDDRPHVNVGEEL